MKKNSTLTKRSLSALPLLLMGATHFSLPPLKRIFDLEPRLLYVWYLIALALSVVVYRRTAVVKDFEYNRAKAMRKIKHVYEAEERGVWSTDVHLDATMDKTTQLGLSQPISAISGEAPEMELGEDNKVEVRMLNEADHIVRANARVSGSANFEEERITGTIGAQRRVGPMDRFLDGVLGLFGIDSRADREAQRQERLRRAATATPVTAQRPVAPIRLNKERDEGEVNMTSMSDSGGVETVMSTSGRVVDSTTTVSNEAQQPTPVESLESMAMMGMKPSSVPGLTTTGPVCRGCEAPVAPNLRFCPHCGLDL